MGRPKKTDPKVYDEGEQIDLIETEPESAKTLARLGRAYLKAKTIVGDAQDVLKRKREALLEAVRDAGIEHDELNPFTFTANKVKITVTPMAEKISVREVGNGPAAEEDATEE